MNQISGYFLLFLAYIYLVVEPVEGIFKLQILHNNDFHGRFAETDVHTGPCPDEYVKRRKCYGGFARMKTASKQAKKKGAKEGFETLYLNAGDFFQGTPYFTVFEWEIVSDMVDRLGLDVMAFGNHEFDLGVDELQEYAKNVNVPIVCTNLDTRQDDRLKLPNIHKSIVYTYQIKNENEPNEEDKIEEKGKTKGKRKPTEKSKREEKGKPRKKDDSDETDASEETDVTEEIDETEEEDDDELMSPKSDKSSDEEKTTKVKKPKEIKVGIVAYLTPLTKNTEDTIIKDEITSIREEARRLREDENVKIVIALGHSGLDYDKKLAAAVPEVDLIIGGDSHDLLYTPMEKPPSIEKAVSTYPTWVEVKRDDGTTKRIPIVQAYAYSKYLGQLFMEFEDDGTLIKAYGNPILLNKSIEKNRKVENAVKNWTRKIIKRVDGFKDIQGYTRTFMRQASLPDNIFQSNMANMITDAFVDAAVQKAHKFEEQTWSKTPISFYPNGGIKMELDNNRAEGVITLEDIMSILPFKNDLCEASVFGSTMWNFLENAVAGYDYDLKTYEWKDYMQFSGLRVKYDVSKPPGQRLLSVDALSKELHTPSYSPLVLDKMYSFIAPCFVVEKFKKFQTRKIKVVELDITDIQAVQDYIQRRKNVASILDDRVQNVELGAQIPENLKT